jgi:hypothetical protein
MMTLEIYRRVLRQRLCEDRNISQSPEAETLRGQNGDIYTGKVTKE